MDVVVRRYIDFTHINYPYFACISYFCPYFFVHFINVFSFFKFVSEVVDVYS